jgi:subtilase family serine protease
MSRNSRRILAYLGGMSLVAAAVGGTTGMTTGATAPLVMPHPTVADYVQMSTSTTPPTQDQCNSVGRRCFDPASVRAAYNMTPLYSQGLDGRGQTIAIVDSYGSDTIEHDLHVYDQAWGLPSMCGEEGATCAAGMPTFSRLALQGSPATTAPPGSSAGTGQEDKASWALEVSLDVETAHAIAPAANILLVTTPTAETLGVQGMPQMMDAEQYVVDNHLATVISQSFASTEEAFQNSNSIEKLRHAFKSAAANGVTVLGSSGDGGTANTTKAPVSSGGTLVPHPTVNWPTSDPLVTSVGGTNLCTSATATAPSRAPDSASPPAACQQNPAQAEVGWSGSGGGFSHVFAKPDYQNTLPAGSAAIGSMRGVPDIAFQASPSTGSLVYVSLPPAGSGGLNCGATPCSTGWYDIGGTSLACPQLAAMVAIADQLNGGGLGLINPALYQIAADPVRYDNDFHDVTTGNNQTVASVPGYPATTGWDPVTGLGTPNAASLVPDLVAAVHG